MSGRPGKNYRGGVGLACNGPLSHLVSGGESIASIRFIFEMSSRFSPLFLLTLVKWALGQIETIIEYLQRKTIRD